MVSGCFHREHSPEAYILIDEALLEIKDDEIYFEEHESGPEIIAWVALGTASLTLAKSVFDFVTAVINARAKGRAQGDTRDGNLVLIIRNTHHTADSKEETVLEIYDKELVSSKQIKDAIDRGLNKRVKK